MLCGARQVGPFPYSVPHSTSTAWSQSHYPSTGWKESFGVPYFVLKVSNLQPVDQIQPMKPCCVTCGAGIATGDLEAGEAKVGPAGKIQGMESIDTCVVWWAGKGGKQAMAVLTSATAAHPTATSRLSP